MALTTAISPVCNSRVAGGHEVLVSATSVTTPCSSLTRTAVISSSVANKISLRLTAPNPRSKSISGSLRKQIICSAVAPAASTQKEYGMDSPKMKEMMAFLEKDLPHLFDEQGIDKSMYDEKVNFVDPVTKYDNLNGYLFNIQVLRRIFSPIFELHSVKQTGPTEITTRWTMTMTFSLLPWKPKLVFTGLSIMTVNPETGKFNSHVDLWDSIENNEYFSFEAAKDVFKQLKLYKTPDLETPKYQVLKRTSVYEVRKYEPFIVAETPSEQLIGNTGFKEVAGYLFGKNTTGESMKMTTPVFNQALGDKSSLQFVLPLNRELSTAPSPLSENVKLQEVDKKFAATLKFNGQATEAAIRERESVLRAALIKDGLQPEEGYLLARYNDPDRTQPFMRRNEVIIWLKNFELQV
ncbi:hypothetical protein R1sor_000085 [Riccia sorocarpa]|uniref:SOUL heme-binding protein n=1 Tax=Riccia sorocarpa TaxID=122646 RepID=A0ABD3GSC3_9MARC